jgi:hypothetical protein
MCVHSLFCIQTDASVVRQHVPACSPLLECVLFYVWSQPFLCSNCCKCCETVRPCSFTPAWMCALLCVFTAFSVFKLLQVSWDSTSLLVNIHSRCVFTAFSVFKPLQVLSDSSSLLISLVASLLAYAFLPLSSLVAKASAALTTALAVLGYATIMWPPRSS